MYMWFPTKVTESSLLSGSICWMDMVEDGVIGHVWVSSVLFWLSGVHNLHPTLRPGMLGLCSRHVSRQYGLEACRCSKYWFIYFCGSWRLAAEQSLGGLIAILNKFYVHINNPRIQNLMILVFMQHLPLSSWIFIFMEHAQSHTYKLMVPLGSLLLFNVVCRSVRFVKWTLNIFSLRTWCDLNVTLRSKRYNSVMCFVLFPYRLPVYGCIQLFIFSHSSFLVNGVCEGACVINTHHRSPVVLFSSQFKPGGPPVRVFVKLMIWRWNALAFVFISVSWRSLLLKMLRTLSMFKIRFTSS